MVDNLLLSPVLDLGEVTGPLLVFGGPYSNLQATQAIRQIAVELGLGSSQVICSGDLVAYCGDPHATAAMIQQWQIPVVMGNCEESLAFAADDCGCGFTQGSSCDLLSSSWYQFSSQSIGVDLRCWMAGLPRRIEFQLTGKRFAVIHGGVEQINQFVFSSTSVDEKNRQLDQLGVDVIIGGHCGIPFGQRLGRRSWLNAGAIGMPANDGTRDGWYLLLSDSNDGLACSWHRLIYDADGAYQKMQSAGLSNGYDRALISGSWPSMDVLPGQEQISQMAPLSIERLII